MGQGLLLRSDDTLFLESDDFANQGVLAGEVVVELRRAHVRGRLDIVHRGAGHSSLKDQLGRRSKDAGSCATALFGERLGACPVRGPLAHTLRVASWNIRSIHRSEAFIHF